MTSKHDKAVIARLMRIKGATMQGDVTVSDSPDHVPRPGKKVKPKSLSISNKDTKGTIVCMEHNEAVKYWRT